MRVLFLERSLGRGGAQRQLFNLAAGLASRGHQVTLALFYNEGELINEIVGTNVSLLILDKKGRWDLFSFLFSVTRLIGHIKPDLMCTFLTGPNLIAIACKWRFPRLRVVCGIRASNMDLRRYDVLTGLSYKLETKLFRFANAVIANSRTGADIAISNGAKGDILVIPNGIDTERYRLHRGERKNLRRGWGIADDEILIGMPGRLDPMKGHHIFLHAAKEVKSSHPKLRFLIAGDDGLVSRRDLMSLAEKLGLEHHIVWSKGRSDMENVYSACDIVCSSSQFGEGFSNTVAEAMACSRTCVATDIGDAKLVLGETGYISSGTHSKALGDAMRNAINDCLSSGNENQAARERIKKHFSIDAMVGSFEKKFCSLLA